MIGAPRGTPATRDFHPFVFSRKPTNNRDFHPLGFRRKLTKHTLGAPRSTPATVDWQASNDDHDVNGIHICRVIHPRGAIGNVDGVDEGGLTAIMQTVPSAASQP